LEEKNPQKDYGNLTRILGALILKRLRRGHLDRALAKSCNIGPFLEGY